MPKADISIHPEESSRIISIEGVQIREDTAFSNHKGKEKRAVRKYAEKSLKKLHVVLEKLLAPDEAVLYVAHAQSPAGFGEQWMFSWHIYYITRSVLVFTNHRILHFWVESNGNWKERLRSVRWGDIEEAKVSGLLFSPALILKYRSGQKEKFWGLKSRDKKTLRLLAEKLLPESAGEVSTTQKMTSLCPTSFTPLEPKTEQCPECPTKFKTDQELIISSLLVPGGGYFYVGLWFFGVMDFLVEALLLFVILLRSAVALGWPDPFLEPLDAVSTPVEEWVGVGILALILGLEKLFTILHGRFLIRQFIPERKPGNRSAWQIAGGVTLAALLVLIGVLAPVRQTAVSVADDLVVTEGHYGLFYTDAEGNLQFRDANVIPLSPGQDYGWVLRVETDRETIRWREEFFQASSTSASTDTPPLPEVGNVGELLNTNEGESDYEQGVFGTYWTMTAEDKPGHYIVRIYVEDVLVKTFAIEVK